MSSHENEARNLKKQGNNCSRSLHTAFVKDTKINDEFPEPRSIEGKCGALLTALKILDEIGHSDKKEEFEKEFIKKFGYNKCMQLMAHERRCNDYVGKCAKMIDEIIGKEQKKIMNNKK